jgi:two-component system nitrate/nitrite response regulator NarL
LHPVLRLRGAAGRRTLPASLSPPSPPSPLRVGLLEERQLVREGLVSALWAEGLQVPVAARVAEPFQQVLPWVRPDVVLLGGGAPAELLGWVKERLPACLTVVLGDGPRTLGAEDADRRKACAWVDSRSTSPGWLVEVLGAVRDGWRVFPACSGEMQEGPLASLSPREQEVIRYITGGADNLKIAACLDITERTVRAHVSAIYRKLGGENRAQLALRGRELGVRPALDV